MTTAGPGDGTPDRRLPDASGDGAGPLPPGEPRALTWGWATDRGRRTRNEDAVLADRTAFFVADGMGGHARGDLAARTALASMSVLAGRVDATAEDCADAVRTAAASIAAIDPGERGPAGTTLSGALVTRDGGLPYWLVVNIGDSRTYLWRSGRLERITVDHSAVRELVDAGEITEAQARVHPERNVITRALGSGLEPRADVWMVPRHPGDLVVVCSDGVSGVLDDDEVARLLRTGGTPGDLAGLVVSAAVRGGGRDNASAVVVAVGGEPDDDCDATQDLPRPNPQEEPR